MSNSSDRDPRGRFAPGNKLAVGNRGGRQPRRVEDRLIIELAARVSSNALAAILDKVVEEARAGKEWAIKFIYAYLVGQPIARQAISISTQDALADWLLDLRRAQSRDADDAPDADDTDDTDDVAPDQDAL